MWARQSKFCPKKPEFLGDGMPEEDDIRLALKRALIGTLIATVFILFIVIYYNNKEIANVL